MPIHFGTDGWRAVISDTFTFRNLRMVTQAIADAVGSRLVEQRYAAWKPAGGRKSEWWSVLTRASSPTAIAAEVARVLAANGFTVFLAQADAPTPAISYAVTQHGHAAAGDHDHRLAQCAAL